MRILVVASEKGTWPYIPELIERLRKSGDYVDLYDNTLGNFRILSSSKTKNTIVNFFSLLWLFKSFIVWTFDKLFKVNIDYRDNKRSKLYEKLGRWLNYDVISVHCATVTNTPTFLLKLGTKVITTIWGSEFLRATDKKRIRNQFIYDKSDFITFNNPLTRSKFLDYYHRYEEKAKILRFGIEAFDRILEIHSSYSLPCIKQQLGFDTDKIIACIGYNAGIAQQHEAIINSLTFLGEQDKDKIQLVILFTYGLEKKAYKEKIITLLENSGISYKLLLSFMSMEDMAKLRLACDVVINAQTTDSLSASVQEHLLVGSRILVGSWLPYAILKEIDKGMIQFDSFNDLPFKLSSVIGLGRDKLYQRKINKELYTLSSWNTNIGEWRKLFQSCLKPGTNTF